MSSEVKRPEKLYYRIGEVSALTGVPSYVLRFWEGEFSNIKPQRTESVQQILDLPDTVDVCRTI